MQEGFVGRHHRLLILRHCNWSGREKRNGNTRSFAVQRNFAYRRTTAASSKDFIYCDAGVVGAICSRRARAGMIRSI
jgi:hypothetical protein